MIRSPAVVPPRPSVAGRTAVVFGAGSSGDGIGIGRAITLALVREGAHVLAVDRDRVGAETTVDLASGLDGSCHAFVADVTDLSAIGAAAEQAERLFGSPTVVVYNVGVQILGPVEDLSEEDWDSSYALNAKGAFLVTKVFAPRFDAVGGGSFVFVSSVASLLSSQTPNVAYGSAKAALNLFVRSLAANYGRRNIRANAVLPGLIDTPMIRQSLLRSGMDVEAGLAARDARCPTGRMGTAFDVAEAVVFLASQQYVSGALLPVDGALTAAMS